MTERDDNTGGGTHCVCCCDEGVVPVGQDVYTKYARAADGTVSDSGEAFRQEVFGPCPRCTKGLATEFPQKGGWGPWGKEGFWQGRPWLDFGVQANNCRCHQPRATRDEVAAGMASIRALMTSTKSVDTLIEPRAALVTVVAGVDPPRTPVATQDVTEYDPDEAMEIPPNVTPAAPADTVDGTAPESDPPGDSSDRHTCPHYSEPKDVPYSREDCAQCNPNQHSNGIPF